MANRKSGLHKEIASIFDGVPVPKDNGAQQSSYASVPEPQRYAPAEPTPQSYSTTSTLEPQQPAPTPPKPAVPEQPKVDLIIETDRQGWWQPYWEQIKGKLFVPKPGVDPKRQKLMVVLVPVLFVALIFILSRVISTPVRGTAKSQGDGYANAATASTNEIDWHLPEPYPETLRDPMKYGSTEVTQEGTDRPVVKGIIYNEYGSSAIIGDQIVKEGENIFGATVTKINKDSVEFEKNGKKWTQKVQ